MIDLKTTYLGLELANPLVTSASPFSKKTSNVRKMEDAGISAVVMYSLFEEQIVQDSLAFNYYMERGTDRLLNHWITSRTLTATMWARTNTLSGSARTKRQWTSQSSPV